MSRYDAVGEAIRRRQAEGVCIFCGGPLVASKLRVKPGPPACVNEKCGRGRGRRVKIRG